MKTLIMGLGGIGQRHLRNLRMLMGNDMEIIAYDPRPNPPVLTDQLKVEEGARLDKKYSLHIFQDLEQALAQLPDAAFICNPTSLHIPAAIRAAQAGCHLFIEKPLSHNLERVDELVSLVESHNLKAVIGYQMRFHPCLKRLAELVQAKKIGRILSVRAEIGEYMPGWHTYEDYRQIYASRQDLGGGVILSQIHEFDYLYWLFGLPHSIYTRWRSPEQPGDRCRGYGRHLDGVHAGWSYGAHQSAPGLPAAPTQPVLRGIWRGWQNQDGSAQSQCECVRRSGQSC